MPGLNEQEPKPAQSASSLLDDLEAKYAQPPQPPEARSSFLDDLEAKYAKPAQADAPPSSAGAALLDELEAKYATKPANPARASVLKQFGISTTPEDVGFSPERALAAAAGGMEAEAASAEVPSGTSTLREVGTGFARGVLNAGAGLADVGSAAAVRAAENRGGIPLVRAVNTVADFIPGYEERKRKQYGQYQQFFDSVAEKLRGLAAAPTLAPAKDLKFSVRPVAAALAGVSEAAPMFAAAAGLTAATKSPYPAGMLYGLTGGARTFREARAKGLSMPKADAIAHIQGAWEGVSEAIPFAKLLGRRGLRAVERIAKGAVTEGLQEVIQTAGTNLIEKFGYDRERAVLTMEEFLRSAVVGIILGGTAAAVVHGKAVDPQAVAEQVRAVGGDEQLLAEKLDKVSQLQSLSDNLAAVKEDLGFRGEAPDTEVAARLAERPQMAAAWDESVGQGQKIIERQTGIPTTPLSKAAAELGSLAATKTRQVQNRAAEDIPAYASVTQPDQFTVPRGGAEDVAAYERERSGRLREDAATKADTGAEAARGRLTVVAMRRAALAEIRSQIPPEKAARIKSLDDIPQVLTVDDVRAMKREANRLVRRMIIDGPATADDLRAYEAERNARILEERASRREIPGEQFSGPKAEGNQPLGTPQPQARPTVVKSLEAIPTPAEVSPAASGKPSRLADRARSALDSLEQQARDEIDTLRRDSTLGANKPIGLAANYVVIGATKIARGAVNFADWSAQMLAEFGEAIRPHLRSLYDSSRRLASRGFRGDEDLRGAAEREGRRLTSRGVDLQAVVARAQGLPPEAEPSRAPTTPAIPTEGDAGATLPRTLLTRLPRLKSTPDSVRQALRDVEPQTYEQHRTSQEYEALKPWLDESPQNRAAAEKVVFGDSPVNAEKTTLAVLLWEKYRAEGNDEGMVKIAETMDPKLREAGRGIQAASLWNNLTGRGWARVFDTFLKDRGQTVPEAARELIRERFAEAAQVKDPTKRAQAVAEAVNFAAAHVSFKGRDWWDAYRYFNMLSNPRAHERNVLSNIIVSTVLRPATLIANRRYREAGTYIKSLGKNVSNAYASMQQAWREYGVTKLEEGISSEDRENAFLTAMRKQGPPGAAANVAWKGLTSVTRALEAQDRFFSTLIEAGETARLLSTGTSLETAQAISKSLAEELLYRNRLGTMARDKTLGALPRALVNMGQKLDAWRNSDTWDAKAISLFVPFVRTPFNVARLGLEISPFAYSRSLNGEAIAQSRFKRGYDTLTPDQKVQVDEIVNERRGRIKLGTGVMLAGIAAAAAGRTTWAAPQDKEEKREFYASGRRPYSVRIGNAWVPMVTFGPFALALAIPAAIRDAWKDNPKYAGEAWWSRLAAGTRGATGFFITQTPLTGAANFLEALQGDDDWTVGRATGFVGSQAIPASGLIRYVNNWIDPYYRRPKGPLETIAADIPGLSQGIEPYKDSLGKPVERKASDILPPYSVGKVDERRDRMYQEYRLALYRKRNAFKNIETTMDLVRRGEVTWDQVREDMELLIDSQPPENREAIRGKLRKEYDTVTGKPSRAAYIRETLLESGYYDK